MLCCVDPSLPNDPAVKLKSIKNFYVFLTTKIDMIYNVVISFESKGVPIDELRFSIEKKVSDDLQFNGNY